MAKSKTATTEEPKGDMVDPLATSPSNDPTRDPGATSTATEPNSKERVGRKVSRTGRNNGGDADFRGRPGLNTDLTGDTLGERQAVSPAETDVIWTNDSKDRWGAGQPALVDLLAQRAKVEEDLEKADK